MMSALLQFPPLRQRARGAAVAVAVAALAALLLAALPAAATSLNAANGGHPSWFGRGIALSDLISGAVESFDSRNLKLTFSDFSLSSDGSGTPDVTGYRVLPIGNGFKLIAPHHHSGEINNDFEIHYSVDAADGLGVSAIRIGMLGGSWGRSTAVGMDVFDADGEALLAQLQIGRDGQPQEFCWPRRGGDGRPWDFASLDDLVASLLVDERISGRNGYFHGGGWAVSHRFKTAPIVPEPTTALLLGVGLTGLGLAGRRRA